MCFILYVRDEVLHTVGRHASLVFSRPVHARCFAEQQYTDFRNVC
jgi:hypothetical protein